MFRIFASLPEAIRVVCWDTFPILAAGYGCLCVLAKPCNPVLWMCPQPLRPFVRARKCWLSWNHRSHRTFRRRALQATRSPQATRMISFMTAPNLQTFNSHLSAPWRTCRTSSWIRPVRRRKKQAALVLISPVLQINTAG